MIQTVALKGLTTSQGNKIAETLMNQNEELCCVKKT